LLKPRVAGSPPTATQRPPKGPRESLQLLRP
jgi:hypothetical protein